MDGEIITRDDLEQSLTDLGVRRYRVVEIRPARVLVVFVRPDKQEIVFENLSDRMVDGIGFYVGTLGNWECLIRRRDYHII
jgi:hypothetical protein